MSLHQATGVGRCIEPQPGTTQDHALFQPYKTPDVRPYRMTSVEKAHEPLLPAPHRALLHAQPPT